MIQILGFIRPRLFFKKDRASEYVLEDEPPDHQMDGTPITERLDWESETRRVEVEKCGSRKQLYQKLP